MLRPTAGSGELPRFWRPGGFRLFITHRSDRAGFALSLKKALAPCHVTCFVAHQDIRPAKDWDAEIRQALETAQALVALVHDGFHASEWTDQEVGFALGRRIFVLAVKLGQEPKGFLRRAQALNGRGQRLLPLARKIFDELNRQAPTSPLLAEALLHGFEISADRYEAMDNMDLLDEMEHWSPQYPDRLRRAVQRNRWIAEARRVSERVEALIHRKNRDLLGAVSC